MEQSKSVAALSQILELLEGFEADQRRRMLQTISTYFDHAPSRPSGDPKALDISSLNLHRSVGIPFSEKTDISPKDFLMQKQPKTDVERIACLAFYLTHYRATPHFKTTDLNVLNIEAAQPKLSNPAKSASNATTCGYLAAAGGDKRQLSGQGEQFVLALPDREAARNVMVRRPVRSRSSKASKRLSPADATKSNPAK
jgi:hypothetical protein